MPTSKLNTLEQKATTTKAKSSKEPRRETKEEKALRLLCIDPVGLNKLNQEIMGTDSESARSSNQHQEEENSSPITMHHIKTNYTVCKKKQQQQKSRP
ncbi:hypothetical protein AVEN_247773-1 [Araneus ventricosus]|uniref:Uncharacterized protein n=1 Tax=Araneus ventricosus TaxID=182803 RepID=A0A4Y2VAG5_ARAVE|nr:hypothetical protein AVEN_247773-1 [Araneus ventricosus]